VSIPVSVIINRVTTTLLDPGNLTNSYWTIAELIDYLNSGMAEAVSLKPDIYTTVGPIPLVPGPLQQLPDGAVQFLEPYYNTADGTAVIMRNIEEIQHSISNWASASLQALDAKIIVPDARDPRRFRCFPPNNGSGNITGLYSAVPPPVSSVISTFPLPANYQNAMWAFVCSQAYAKNTVRGDLNKSKDFYAMFVNSITGNTQADATDAPDNELTKQKAG